MITPVIFGILGEELSKQEVAFFQESNPAGFILFSRNIKSRQQLQKLTTHLKSLFKDRKVPIFVDQEGGRVARIKPPVSAKNFPAASYFSSLYKEDKKTAKCEVRQNYFELMSELNSLGVDSPCAPVCDIYHEGADNIVGDRSFGSDENQVVDLAKSAISGITDAQGIAIIKHIPGHGRAMVDSHLDLPVITESIDVLEATDFSVFKELASENCWGMVAHIIYKELDAENPVTISKKAVNYIRTDLGFSNTLTTDDICMYAMHGEIGQQHLILTKALELIKLEQNWRKDYAKKLKNLFGMEIFQLDETIIQDMLQKKLKEIEPYFLDNLAKTSKMALDAGIDLVMHCSGKMDEMQTIYNKLK